MKNKIINTTALLFVPSLIFGEQSYKAKKKFKRITYGALAIACVPLFLIGVSIHWTIYAFEDLRIIKR